ncbi:hypothetical protein [Pontiella sulfatireligans]|uniref:Uncharacterized protein n=1 Tax=Pontiella sulfatireligans TaxID=2750658 RepID=A0A6C2UIF3_9BACT|nr:hypothetical protein [Pontiella sulfatireligans]VGO19104.1 hypothetical protein SCARR_01160 [Pontiella sulfatireligans]
MKRLKIKFMLLVMAVLSGLSMSVQAWDIGLTADTANTPAPGFGNIGFTLDDPFAYDSDTPMSPMPDITSRVLEVMYSWAKEGDAILSYILTDGVFTVASGGETINLDFYGRELTPIRDDDFDVVLYNGDYSTPVATLTGLGIDDGTFYTRGSFTLAEGTQFDRIQITGHNSDPATPTVNNFTLAEIRMNTRFAPPLVFLPADGIVLNLAYPETLSSGTVDVTFSPSSIGGNVQITAVDVIRQTHPGAFRVSGFSSPMVLSGSTPSTVVLADVEFDLSVAGLSHGQTSTGLFEVVWNEIGGATYTNTQPASATYSAPPASLILPGSLAMSLDDPATSVSSNLTVSFTADTIAPANVEITAVLFADASHAGFSCSSVPLTLTDAVPSNTLAIAFDNASDSLPAKETATATAQVIWNETGKVDSQTNAVSVSVFRQPVAANVTVDKITTPVDTDVLTNNVVAAVNWGEVGIDGAGLAVPVTVNGVDFAVEPVLTTSSKALDVTYGAAAIGQLQITGTGVKGYNKFDASVPDVGGNINTLFSSMAVSANDDYNLSFTDLQEGEAYYLQLFFSGGTQGRAVDIFQAGNPTAIASWSNVADVQTIITLSWVANATGTESFSLPTAVSGDACFNGFAFTTEADVIVTPPYIELGGGSGENFSMSSSNMTPLATYILQSTTDMAYNNWLDIATTTGVSEVNWDSVIVPTNNAEFFRVISE